MLSSTTVAILKSLSLAELKRFGDFVKSPYHNTTSSLEIIFDTVLKSYPDFNSKNLSYEIMAKKIFPSGENKEKRVKNLYSEFGNLLRKFLGYEEMNYKLYEIDILIAEALSRKSLFEDSEKFIKKSIEQNDNGLLTDDAKFFYKFRMYTQRTQNMNQLNIDFDLIKKVKIDGYESFATSFLRDTFVLAENISIEKKMGFLTHDNGMNEAILASLDMDKFFKHLKDSGNKLYSYLKIIFSLYYYIENKISREQLDELKNEIANTVFKIEKWEAFLFISNTIEIILLQLVPTGTSYNKDILDLSKLFCELKVFPTGLNYFFPVGSFRDMFTTALNLKEYDWAENFVNEYSQYLSEEFIENEQNFCKGILNFKRGQYEESLDFFSGVKLDEMRLKISVRFYYIMNYIEMKAYESARSAIHAFRQFYNDNKEIPEFRIHGTIPDSLKYLNEIIKCEETGTKIDGLLYKEANDGRRFLHSIYIKDKMEKLK